MKRSILSFAVMFSLCVGCLVSFFNGDAQAQTLTLWDGETAGATFDYGSANNTQAYQGKWCFEGTPDKWHAPGIILNGLSTWRADVSGYDEIWFYAKASTAGQTFAFSVYAWPNFSKSVNIDPYIVGDGGLTTSYKLVRVPVAALKTSTYSLNSVEILYFGTAKSNSGYKIYIDNVQAVKLTPGISASPSSLSFGNVNVGSSGTQTLTVSNPGTAALNVTNITLSGADASQFSASPTSFSVNPGQSQTVTVTFAPTSAGSKTASLSIAHNATGSPSTVALSGTGAVRQLLWNGETAGATFEYGSANNTQAYQGTWCFEGAPDAWHSPSIGLSGLSAWRMDLSGYDEIQFYAKADMTGRTFDFSVYGWPYTSNVVNIDPYIVGGG